MALIVLRPGAVGHFLKKVNKKMKSPEDCAMVVLQIYVNHFNVVPDDSLGPGNFLSVKTIFKITQEEISTGLQFALERSWVEELPNGWHMLTKTGYNKAQEIA